MAATNLNRGGASALHDNSRGFTIVEMMISMVVFIIVTGAIYGLLEVGRRGRFNTNQRWEVLQNVRIGLNAVGRDAINAGVDFPNSGAMIPSGRLTIVGGANDGDANPDFLTPVFGVDSVNPVNGTPTDQVTFLYVDDTWNSPAPGTPGTSIPASAISNNTVNPTTITIQTGYNNNPFNVGDVYLITGQNGSALGMLTSKSGTNGLTFAATDPLLLNNSLTNAAINRVQAPASILRARWVTYFVADQDGLGNGTGTLMRRVYGGFDPVANRPISWSDQPLAFGIENMQIQYVLSTGIVRDTPSLTEMPNIRQVRVSISVRSPDNDPKNRDPITGAPQPFRTTVTSMFSTRNLVYEKL